MGGLLKLGDRVIVSSQTAGTKTGTLRFLGPTDFAAGEWAGVELDAPIGKNDGSVGDRKYFECKAKFGLFAPLHKVSLKAIYLNTGKAIKQLAYAIVLIKCPYSKTFILGHQVAK